MKTSALASGSCFSRLFRQPIATFLTEELTSIANPSTECSKRRLLGLRPASLRPDRFPPHSCIQSALIALSAVHSKYIHRISYTVNVQNFADTYIGLEKHIPLCKQPLIFKTDTKKYCQILYVPWQITILCWARSAKPIRARGRRDLVSPECAWRPIRVGRFYSTAPRGR